MRIFGIVVILVLTSSILSCKVHHQVQTVCYYYNGKNEEIIEKGLKDWNFVKNVKFVRTEEQKLTTLKFVEVTSKQMYVDYRFGEYNFFTNTIKLNADKQLTKRQWIAIVSHEVGHYFLLQHTKDKTSIMSNSIYLNDADKKQAIGNLSTVLLINKVRGWLDPLYPLICKKL